MTTAANFNKTFLFYDIETTGFNYVFDRILQFAAIRTDLHFNELARYEWLIKLAPDTVPSPEALLVHQISLAESSQGLSEIEAVRNIHQLVNEPGTISIGYNNLKFDDKFLRFSFYRNLLPPYTHQFANQCGRADLYPLALLYFLFKPEVLCWEYQGKPSLKLEHLSEINQLAEGPAHRAITDVLATLALARRLAKAADMWQYALDYFDKKIATERANKLTHITLGDQVFPVALYVDSILGYEQNFLCPALGLGYHRHYKNQTLWLRLDKPELLTTTLASIPQTTWVMRKKINETGLLLPMQPRFLEKLSAERQATLVQTQYWLSENLPLLQSIVDYHLDYKYPEIPNLDVDAALYQNGFPSTSEQNFCQHFHKEPPQQKASLIDKQPNANLRTQLIRVMGRYYAEYLSPSHRAEYLAYLQKVNPADPADALLDYRGKPRLTPKAAQEEIAAFLAAADLTEKQIALLNELNDYLRKNFS